MIQHHCLSTIYVLSGSVADLPPIPFRHVIESHFNSSKCVHQRSAAPSGTLLNSMQKQVADFNARIAAMEAELGVTPSKDQPAQADSGTESSAALPASAQDEPAQTNPDAHGSTLALATPANSVMDARGVSYLSQKQQGPFPYVPGKGFVLASGPNGEVDFFVKGYVRYLNQLGLDRFYTDAFGRTFELDLRQDIQLNRLQWGLHGWLFDPRFRYFWYAWTQNVSQGDPAQVVVGGNIAYKFDDALTATAGILVAFDAINRSVIPELVEN